MIVENFWNKSSKQYAENVSNEISGQKAEQWRSYILSEIGEDTPLNILDVGTGPGFFPVILSSKHRKVTGIDLTEGMIRQANEMFRHFGINAEALLMDCQNTSFDDESFDCIICRNLVWTIEDPKKAYREWYRLLKPGGQLLVFDGSWYIHHFDEEQKKRFETKAKELWEKYQIEAHSYGDPQKYPDDHAMMKHLYLSDKKRPEWDAKFLGSIGFQIEKIVPEYLSEIIGEEETRKSPSISPLFFIKAKK